MLRTLSRYNGPRPLRLIADMASSFQAAVVEVLAVKTAQAAREFGAACVALSGGVYDQTLRILFLQMIGDGGDFLAGMERCVAFLIHAQKKDFSAKRGIFLIGTMFIAGGIGQDMFIKELMDARSNGGNGMRRAHAPYGFWAFAESFGYDSRPAGRMNEVKHRRR